MNRYNDEISEIWELITIDRSNITCNSDPDEVYGNYLDYVDGVEEDKREEFYPLFTHTDFCRYIAEMGKEMEDEDCEDPEEWEDEERY